MECPQALKANLKRWTIYFLRAFLGLLAVLLLAAQVVFFPILSGELAQEYPELAWARWPLLAAVIVLLLGVQVVLGCVWRLLSMVADDTVFTTAAFRYVDMIVRIVALEAFLLAAVNVFLSYGVNANPPALSLGILLLFVAAMLVWLLMLVMRHLLEKATTLREELEQVV